MRTLRVVFALFLAVMIASALDLDADRYIRVPSHQNKFPRQSFINSLTAAGIKNSSLAYEARDEKTGNVISPAERRKYNKKFFLIERSLIERVGSDKVAASELAKSFRDSLVVEKGFSDAGVTVTVEELSAELDTIFPTGQELPVHKESDSPQAASASNNGNQDGTKNPPSRLMTADTVVALFKADCYTTRLLANDLPANIALPCTQQSLSLPLPHKATLRVEQAKVADPPKAAPQFNLWVKLGLKEIRQKEVVDPDWETSYLAAKRRLQDAGFSGTQDECQKGIASFSDCSVITAPPRKIVQASVEWAGAKILWITIGAFTLFVMGYPIWSGLQYSQEVSHHKRHRKYRMTDNFRCLFPRTQPDGSRSAAPAFVETKAVVSPFPNSPRILVASTDHPGDRVTLAHLREALREYDEVMVKTGTH